MKIRTTRNLGSHLPMLMKIASCTSGPILELGAGTFSTPYLHWICYEKKRKLVTFESNKEMFYPHIKQYEADYHSVNYIEDWDKIDITGPWVMALVDHDPNGRRVEEIKRLANNTDYIVVHDTEAWHDFKYHYSTIYHLFKYRYDFQPPTCPFTSVFSNRKELSWLK